MSSVHDCAANVMEDCGVEWFCENVGKLVFGGNWLNEIHLWLT